MSTPRPSVRLGLLLLGASLAAAILPGVARAHEFTPTAKEGIVVEVGKTATLQVKDPGSCKAFLDAFSGNPNKASISSSPNGAVVKHTYTIKGLEPGVTFVSVGVTGTGTDKAGNPCPEVSTTIIPVIVVADLSEVSNDFKKFAAAAIVALKKELKEKIKAANIGVKELIEDAQDGLISWDEAWLSYMFGLAVLQESLEACTRKTLDEIATTAQVLLTGADVTEETFPPDFQHGGCGTWDSALQKACAELEKSQNAVYKQAKMTGKTLQKLSTGIVALNLVQHAILLQATILPNVVLNAKSPAKELRSFGAASRPANPALKDGGIAVWGQADPSVGTNIKVTARGPGPTTKMVTVVIVPNTCFWFASFADLGPGLWTLEIQYEGKDEPKAGDGVVVGIR